MQAIKPLSAYDTPFDVSDFPACVAAFTADSIVDGVLYELVSGAYITTSSTFTDNGDGTFQSSLSALAMSASFPSLGTDDGMIVFVGDCTNSDVARFGAAAGQSIWVGTSGGILTRVIGTNFHSVPALTKSGLTTGAMAVAFDNSANTAAIHAVDAVATEYETAATVASAGTLTGTWDSIGNTLAVPVNTPIGGVYLMKWSAVPSANDIKQALAWMSANPTKGLYPGWKGVS